MRVDIKLFRIHGHELEFHLRGHFPKEAVRAVEQDAVVENQNHVICKILLLLIAVES